MIDPARIVPVGAGVDHIAIFEREKESVMRFVRAVRRKIHRFFPRQMPAGVFDDPRPFSDRRDRIHTEAMNAGRANLDPGVGRTTRTN